MNATIRKEAAPNINITPLIDILLVLLIIFMVISPLKPAAFKAKLPQEPKSEKDVKVNLDTLIVSVDKNLQLKLNQQENLGSVNDMEKLSETLAATFQKRKEARAYKEGWENLTHLPEDEKIERTVFIKAPRSISYGEAAKVIDAVKAAGAEPIALQIDDLLH